MLRRLSALSLGLAASLGALLGAPPATAQCTLPGSDEAKCTTALQSPFLGDLNNDLAVNATDVTVWNECFLANVGGNGIPVYCRAADFNYDGLIDTVDRDYLNQLVAMAADANIGRLPKVTFSELRVRKPTSQTSAAVPQSRYAEFRLPTAAAALDGPVTVQTSNPGDPADIFRFGAGWFYVKVCRSTAANGTDIVSGTIAVVQDLQGMPWIRDQANSTIRNLAMIADGSFTTPPSPLLDDVPLAVVPFIFNAAGSLAVPSAVVNGRLFPAETATNVTHLLVFRNPNPANTRAVPTVGQRVNLPQAVDPTAVCELAFVIPGAVVLPPWDALVDGITLVRGTAATTWGCIYADTDDSTIGPIGTVGETFAPQHVLRCRTANTLVKGANAITSTSDTPFARNPLCTASTANCGELNPNGTPRSCFEAQAGPYCSDPDCCAAVCAIRPSCCSQVWDQQCADQAAVTCVTCGTSEASCIEVHPTPSCADADCCNLVCQALISCCEVAWDQSCVDIAVAQCLSCGFQGAGDCDVVHDLPYCNDPQCCEKVCAANPFCCAVTWDQSCVRTAEEQCAGCGSNTAGPCCIVHPTPYCNDSGCCAAVCATDPFCCSSAWDLSCTQLAKITPACADLGCVCGEPSEAGAPFGCFEIHALPGCENDLCCQTVCIRDPYCCYVTWDNACVLVAQDLCSQNPGCINPVTSLPVNGSCFVPHLTPGCDKPGCCSQVCATPAFEYCCQILWDEACATLAADICDECGDPLAGSCYSAHNGPNCANEACCNTVCNIDPFCCEGTWDGLCAQTAQASCADPIDSCGVSGRSCWIPNYLPGCSDGTCCTLICGTIDPFCCEARWDAVCAREAGFLCTPTFPVVTGTEGCLEPHRSPGCANRDCTVAVCSVDPTCCTTAWDTSCALAAVAVCPAPEACPAEGDCFTQHATPGCRDSACCNGVCAADPTCCQSAWDGACVSLANTLCKVPADSGWTCPCRGGCFEAHGNPGCDDGSCCSIVCNASPACCNADWDEDCVRIARLLCCGAPGCGSGCNGECLVPHETPYCSDPYCCDAVCRVDPLCCLSSWDSLCVSAAAERCGSACGLEPAGDCFVPHDFPSCRDGVCCGKVCAIDPLCCTLGWDGVCVDIASAPEQADFCKRKECGDYDAGPSCRPHANGASDNATCCKAVCALDPYCCDTEWDINCVDAAVGIEACGCSYECGDTCAGDCCRAHDNGSCDDAECCALICASDPYCCDTLWDSVCASEARARCTGKTDACPLPPCGSDLLPSCCVPSDVPNCSNESCCEAVCALDPFCCTTAWDTTCVLAAAGNAACDCQGPVCGDPTAGSCFTVHDDPFCDEAGCCQLVCSFDTACCSVSWDADCVALAQFFCGGNFAPLVDHFRGGPLETTRGRERFSPPAGWIPPRQRATLRTPVKLPPSIPVPERPATEKLPLPGREPAGDTKNPAKVPAGVPAAPAAAEPALGEDLSVPFPAKPGKQAPGKQAPGKG